MKLEDINPYIRYVRKQSRYETKKNRMCYDCRLFFVLEGSGTFQVGGQTYDVGPDFCVFLPPASKYEFAFDTPRKVKVCVFDFDLISKFSDICETLKVETERDFDINKVLHYPISPEFCNPIVQNNCISIKNDILGCVELFIKKTRYYKHSASAHLKHVLFELLRESSEKNSGRILVCKIQDYIKNNYEMSELNNSQIAEHFRYHPYYLNRLMKSYTNNTMHEYLVNYRIHIAKTLLTTTDMSVTEIAQTVGFLSYTHFIKMFRNKTGSTPLQYRKRHTIL